MMMEMVKKGNSEHNEPSKPNFIWCTFNWVKALQSSELLHRYTVTHCRYCRWEVGLWLQPAQGSRSYLFNQDVVSWVPAGRWVIFSYYFLLCQWQWQGPLEVAPLTMRTKAIEMQNRINKRSKALARRHEPEGRGFKSHFLQRFSHKICSSLLVRVSCCGLYKLFER